MNKKIIGDRYQVIHLLGKKPGYRTILCNDIQTQQLVVVKLLVWNEDFEWQNFKLFEREARVLQSISHPAIPRYLDYFEVNKPQLKGFGLVQTYIKAQSLETHLQSGRTFSIEEVKQLTLAVLKILIYLHSQQPPIIHRDIKPSNILLTNRSGNSIGNVYLIDFGSVKTLAAATSGTMTVVGTYGYMSPEQFGGKVLPKSDLYSLGATLIYLMTGMHPANLPQKDGKIQFEKLVDCGDDFAIWLKRMIEVGELRFPSAKAALQGLKQPSINNNANYLTNKQPLIRKPFGSKVKLKKHKHILEIIIPPRGNSKLNENLVFLFIKFFSFTIKMLVLILTSVLILSAIFSVLAYPMSIFISLVLCALLLILGVGIYVMNIALIVSIIKNLIKALTYLFRGERLQIEPDRITSSSDWLCFKRCFPRYVYLFRNNIDKLEKVLIAENNKWEIMANIKGYKYKIAPKSDLTEVEIDWLCSELSEYLNLPLEDS